MFSVISEVWLDPSHREGYVNWAAELKAELLKMDGFISIERFQSLRESDKLLSPQFWHDEACLTAWHNLEVRGVPRCAKRGPQYPFQRLPLAHRQGNARLRTEGARAGTCRFAPGARLSCCPGEFRKRRLP